MMHPSSARLGSARIQLELEVFQLGSARRMRFLSQLAFQKLGSYEPKLTIIIRPLNQTHYHYFQFDVVKSILLPSLSRNTQYSIKKNIVFKIIGKISTPSQLICEKF